MRNRSKRETSLYIPTLIATACLLVGCGGSATRVPIKVQVQAAIDLNEYSNFAVIPFVELKGSDAGQIRAPEEAGEELASLMRIGLGRQQNVDVVSTQETTRMLTGEALDEKTVMDEAWLSRLGRYFDADAVISGAYSFLVLTEPRHYLTERYDTYQQRYITEYQNYLQRTYMLTLKIKVVNVETQSVIWDETYQRKAVDAHSLGSFLVAQATPQDSILKNLSRQAIGEFTRKVSPHYEVEERFLVK